MILRSCVHSFHTLQTERYADRDAAACQVINVSFWLVPQARALSSSNACARFGIVTDMSALVR